MHAVADALGLRPAAGLRIAILQPESCPISFVLTNR